MVSNAVPNVAAWRQSPPAKRDSEVLLTVTMAISETLVMPEDFLTLLIHNGAGGSQAG